MSGFCQECWNEAYLIAETRGVPQGEVYNSLIRSRSVNYHAEKHAKTGEVPAQELQTQNEVPAQAKRRAKRKSK
jgi:hypothetical protein